jgi:hypothetical protein
MVSNLQNILCPFINISNNFAYWAQLKNNMMIALQAYDDAYNHANYLVMRLNNIFVSSDLKNDRNVPLIMQLLAPPESDGTTPNLTPIKLTLKLTRLQRQPMAMQSICRRRKSMNSKRKALSHSTALEKPRHK